MRAAPLDPEVVEARIRDVMLREAGLSATLADAVAFHMTDWFGDLERFVDFCEEPDKWKDEDVKQMLLAFLLHVPNHLAAAAKLSTGLAVTDVFDVGAVEDESDKG